MTRLIDMGIKPFLVASSIQAIMAQRLIRITLRHEAARRGGATSIPSTSA
jgi:type II secretory ATPase GspE/PulE/Tfp pilus assembly ATPase PilB-like protein